MGDFPNHPGIYAIRHLESNRAYIGSAKNIYSRWRGHKSNLRHGVHHAKHLQNAWNKYGEDAFVFEVLETCLKDSGLLLHREQWWLDHAKCRLFNCTRQAISGAGRVVSDAQKAVMSQKMKGNRNGAGKSYCGVLTEDDVRQILLRFAKGEDIGIIASDFNVHQATVSRIGHRKIWKDVGLPEAVEAARAARSANPKSGRFALRKKLDWDRACEIRRLASEGVSPFVIADRYSVSYRTVYLIVRWKAWAVPPIDADSLVLPSVSCAVVPQSVKIRTAKRPHRVLTKPRTPRVVVACKACGSDIMVAPCKLKKQNAFTCSLACRKAEAVRRTTERMADPKVRQHLASLNRGKKQSEETKAKRRASVRATYLAKRGGGPTVHEMRKSKGLPHVVSEATRRLIAEANRGKKASDETKAKMSASQHARQAKLHASDLDSICAALNEGVSISAISRQYEISRQTIRKVQKGDYVPVPLI